MSNNDNNANNNLTTLETKISIYRIRWNDEIGIFVCMCMCRVMWVCMCWGFLLLSCVYLMWFDKRCNVGV